MFLRLFGFRAKWTGDHCILRKLGFLKYNQLTIVRAHYSEYWIAESFCNISVKYAKPQYNINYCITKIFLIENETFIQ